MIRALIGRVLLHCIEQAKRRSLRMEVRQVDPAAMSDQMFSDWLHGRPINWGTPGIAKLVFQGKVR